MPSDFYYTGWVDHIDEKDGSSNGRTWKRTNFCIHEPFVVNGEQKEDSTYLTSFNELGLKEGEWYRVGARLRKKKDQDGKFAGFDVQAVTATMLTPSVQDARANSQETRTQASARQYANAAPQQRQWQPAPRQEAPKGPESFRDDDIPF